jgi:pilus assembly protein TadC
VVTLGVGALAGLGAAAAAAVVGGRRPRPATRPPDLASGGAAEAVELVAVALGSGLSTVAALAAVAPLAPPAARGPLEHAVRRLRGGEAADAAFAGGGLAAVGAVLAASDRWGAPADPALRRLAAELRATRRAAAEEAAERTQLSLVFPTTLLTLPAFAVGVVPPLLWTAFAAAGG